VSVIIPCYNYARFLDYAVQTVLAQTVAPLEVLLIDDGSTDETPQLAARYSAPVRYIRQENAGLSAARNRGIREARGEFVAFLDADDGFEPQMLERCLAEFERLGAGWGLVAVQPRGIDAEGKPLPRNRLGWRFAGEVTGRQLLVKNRFVPTVVVRRALFAETGGFDPEFRSSEDREMWIRLAEVTRLWLLDEDLVLKRNHGSNMSGNAARQSANIEKVLHTARLAGRAAPPGDALFWAKAWSFYYFQSSLMFYGNRNWSMTMGNMLRSIVLWPYHGDRGDLVQPPLFRARWLTRILLDFIRNGLWERRGAGEDKAMIRVMHVVLSLEPGGMENGVVNMANRLDGKGVDIRVGALCRPGEFQERLPSPEKLESLGKGEGFSLKHVFALARLFRQRETRVAHTHNLGPLLYTVLALAVSPRLWGRVHILHGEHAELNETERTGKRLLQRKLFYKACRIVHTVSHSLKDDLVRMGLPDRKIAVAVNGVDTARFCPAAPGAEARRALLEACGMPGGAPEALVLGMVGRFGKYKRQDFLVRAFERTVAARPDLDLHLVLVGDKGPEKDRVLAMIAESPARARIHLAGFQRDVRPFYQVLDLLVVPSINEGLSNAVLEAMSTGLPVLGSSACGNAEVMEDGRDGFVRDLGTPELLATALEELVADRERLRRVGQAARDTAIARFSLESMAARYQELYRDCAR
jgi:glycosyltransferase involved in cell wall biosynthesis